MPPPPLNTAALTTMTMTSDANSWCRGDNISGVGSCGGSDGGCGDGGSGGGGNSVDVGRGYDDGSGNSYGNGNSDSGNGGSGNKDSNSNSGGSDSNSGKKNNNQLKAAVKKAATMAAAEALVAAATVLTSVAATMMAVATAMAMVQWQRQQRQQQGQWWQRQWQRWKKQQSTKSCSEKSSNDGGGRGVSGSGDGFDVGRNVRQRRLRHPPRNITKWSLRAGGAISLRFFCDKLTNLAWLTLSILKYLMKNKKFIRESPWKNAIAFFQLH
jgi:hypothetical protein